MGVAIERTRKGTFKNNHLVTEAYFQSGKLGLGDRGVDVFCVLDLGK